MAIQHRITTTATKGIGGNDSSITLDATIQDGDLLVAWFVQQNDTATITDPVGWTLIPDGIERHSAQTLLGGIWYKIAGADDAESVITWSSTNTQRTVIIVSAFFDDGGTAWDSPPLDVSATNEQASASGTYTLPTDTTTVDNALVIGTAASVDTEGGTQDHTHNHLTERGQDAISTTIASLSSTVQASQGSTGTKTVTFSGTSANGWAGQLAAFKLADGGGGTAVQGAATASQAQTATTVATLTEQGTATSSQAQAATAVATLTEQGAATASQAQTATTVAALTEQGAATATQAQAATTAATLTEQAASSATQGQTATTVATLTVQGAATASQDQIATTSATTGATVSGAASASQGQAATTVATLTEQGGATAAQAQLATAIAQLRLAGVAAGIQGQAAATVARLIVQGAASASQGQVATTSASESVTEVGTGQFIVELASGGVFSVSLAADGQFIVERASSGQFSVEAR